MKVFGLMKPRIRVVAGHRIDTDRLTLRAPIVPDAAPISALLENWNVAHWLVRVPFPYRAEHAAAWIERSIQERAAGVGWPYLILRRDDNVLMGCMDISIEGAARGGTLGYWLGEGYWGHGYATEAAHAAVDWAWTNLEDRQVISLIDRENTRSIRVAERLGMAPSRQHELDGVQVTIYALQRPRQT